MTMILQIEEISFLGYLPRMEAAMFPHAMEDVMFLIDFALPFPLR